MTFDQPDPSDQAPWTKTMFVAVSPNADCPSSAAMTAPPATAVPADKNVERRNVVLMRGCYRSEIAATSYGQRPDLS
jgi:hypothetical protein